MNKTLIPVPYPRYEEMMNKAVRLDTLTGIIRTEIDKGNKYPVKDEIVLSFLELSEYKAAKENEE